MGIENILKHFDDSKEKAKTVYGNEDFSNPLHMEFGPGKIMAASSIGHSYLCRNEDRIIICPTTTSFAIIDGMGGYGNGDEMADILKEELLKEMAGAITEIGLGKMHTRASLKMKEKIFKTSAHDGGAAYTLCKYYKRELIVAHAGDVSAGVVDSKGEVINMLESTPLRECPTGSGAGITKIDTLNCFGGSTVILGSDGFWDNIDAEEARKIVSSNSLQLSFQELFKYVESRMNSSEGKKDNISLVLFRT